MINRTVVGLIAEGYESNWGVLTWLSDSDITEGAYIQAEVGTNEDIYLALNTPPRNKVLSITKLGGTLTDNRRIGAGVITAAGFFVGIGRAFPHTRAEPWQVLVRAFGNLIALQTSLNNASTSSFPVWTKFFVDDEIYTCLLGSNTSEVLTGEHNLDVVGFRPGAIAQNEVAPVDAGQLSLVEFHTHADRYIYVYDLTIPDGYTAWLLNNTSSQIGVPAVFANGVALIDLLEPTLTQEPSTWSKVAIYDGITQIDISTTSRVYGGDVFGVIPAPDTPTITIDEITTLSARLNGSALSGGNGAHVASQWQVQLLGGDWFSPVIDTGLDPVNLLIYETGNVLTDNTYYEARVRYENENGEFSEYSDSAIFLTLTITPVITSCDIIEPIFLDEDGGTSGECGGIPISFEEC